MNLTNSMLQAGTGCTAAAAAKWLPHLQAACDRYQINTRLRVAAFLAQIGHESGHLVYVREIWGPTAAQRGYEGRKDLGNTQPGDGLLFRGRGLIQITGRANYAAMGLALSLPLLAHPELLEQSANAALSAGQFWQGAGISRFADAGDIDGVSDMVNRGHKTAALGDANGFAERKALYLAALKAIPT